MDNVNFYIGTQTNNYQLTLPVLQKKYQLIETYMKVLNSYDGRILQNCLTTLQNIGIDVTLVSDDYIQLCKLMKILNNVKYRYIKNSSDNERSFNEN